MVKPQTHYLLKSGGLLPLPPAGAGGEDKDGRVRGLDWERQHCPLLWAIGLSTRTAGEDLRRAVRARERALGPR